MKIPEMNDALKCLDLRKRSKRGEHITVADSQFCARMYLNYPDWYNKQNVRVFNETVPFGSNVRIEEPNET